MPIKIPDQLPAAEVLGQENIFVMTESRAVTQNIRPLRVLILNLMPKKIEIEIQLMRMLSNSPLQVDVDLLRIDDRESKNTPQAHLENFYHDFEQVRGNNYDGMIITGDDDLTEESYFMDCYSSDERTWRWQWVSQPMQSTITRAMKVSEIVIVAQGQGTIQIFLSGSDTDEEMTQFDFDSTRHPVRIARSVNIDTTDLVVRIDARGRGTSEATVISEAPTLHSIHLGSRTAHQVPRD